MPAPLAWSARTAVCTVADVAPATGTFSRRTAKPLSSANVLAIEGFDTVRSAAGTPAAAPAPTLMTGAFWALSASMSLSSPLDALRPASTPMHATTGSSASRSAVRVPLPRRSSDRGAAGSGARALRCDAARWRTAGSSTSVRFAPHATQ